MLCFEQIVFNFSNKNFLMDKSEICIPMLFFTHKIYHLIFFKLFQAWKDEKLKWNASDYGGLKQAHLGIHEVWQPDVVLYNR